MEAMESEPIFLCDEMLAGLGKWLRVAGYDTRIAEPGTADRELLAVARAEGRLLLTRDRKMLERKGAAGTVFLIETCGLQSWVATLRRELGVNWLYRPFSRCLLCNGELAAGPGPYAGQIPADMARDDIAAFHCPHCGKAFWAGGHVERMRRKLEAWQK